MRPPLLIGMLFSLLLFQLQAKEQSIADIAARAQAQNFEVRKAERAVLRAGKDLAGESILKTSSVAIEGGYHYLPGGSLPPPRGFSGEVSLSVPILNQLSLGGEISLGQLRGLAGEISLSANPFVAKRTTYEEQESLGKALVHLSYLKRKIHLEAEALALTVLSRNQERVLSRSFFELEQKKYDLVRKRQELGEASFQEVQDQLATLASAQQSIFDMESRYVTDWKDLQLLFTSGEEEVAVKSLSLPALLKLIERREQRIEELQAADTSVGAGSERLENLKLELQALQTELQLTPVWRPDVDISASLGLPGPEFTVSAGLSFSPSELNRDERDELKQDIAEKLIDIKTEVFSHKLEKDLSKRSISIAEQALTSALIREEAAAISLEEAELLFKQGQRHSLELEQLTLNLRRTEIERFKAAANLYKAQAETLKLFVPVNQSE